MAFSRNVTFCRTVVDLRMIQIKTALVQSTNQVSRMRILFVITAVILRVVIAEPGKEGGTLKNICDVGQ